MAFNPELMTTARRRKPYLSPACTYSDLYFLEDLLIHRINNLKLNFFTNKISIDSVPASITLFQKTISDPTYLIVKSSNPDLEGLIIQRAKQVALDEKYILRYLNGGVCFSRDTTKYLEVLLEPFNLEYPTTPYVALTYIVNLLSELSLPVGEYFEQNTKGMYDWLNYKHPKLASVPWPTSQDRTAR